MEKFEKELEKLRQLEEEYSAMCYLHTDEEIIKQQDKKIKAQIKKVVKVQEKEEKNEKSI